MKPTPESTDRKFWLPNIVDLDGLFCGRGKEALSENAGFPNGSCILLSGSPGTGKTIVTLAMIRALMSQHRDARTCFISPEISFEKLAKDFASFGWFGSDDPIFCEDKMLMPELPDLGVNHVANSAGGLISLAISVTREHARQHKHDDKPAPLFVIVDSLTALLKDSRSEGDRRRAAHTFMLAMTKSVFHTPPALIFLISEHPLEDEMIQQETPPEEYVADFVFRLWLRHTPGGRRLRIFEVAKSRGARMLLGEHGLAIVTPEHLKDVVAQPLLAQHIEDNAKTVNNGAEQWGTILIAPRPQLTPIGKTYLPPTAGELNQADFLSTGTPGLDAMLNGTFDYWVRQDVQQPKALYRGSTTLLLGSTGTGKTIICLQFLLADEKHVKPDQTLYVNFDNPPKHTVEMFPTLSQEIRDTLRRCNFLYRRRINFDVNLFFSELCHVIASKNVERVVIDGLSDILMTTDKLQRSGLIESLIASIGDASEGRATTFVTYEVPPDFAAFAPPIEGLSVTADNIVALRHVPVHDELRKTVHVLKSRGHRPDKGVREIRIIRTTAESPNPSQPLQIGLGLESYRNLLAGEPEPLTITLNLFAENKPERDFIIKYLLEEIQKRFGYKVNTSIFSRSQMTRTLEDATSPVSTVPVSDIQILSLDEWWIREYAVDSDLGIGAAEESTQPHPLVSLDQFLGPRAQVTHDERSKHYVFEIEKASVVLGHESGQHSAERYTLGVPNYIDFGLFCVNRPLWEKLFEQTNGDSFHRDVVAAIPRVWSLWNGKQFITSDNERSLHTIVEFLRTAKEKHSQKPSDQPFVGFAFDMETISSAVCTYLEFCWAFGATEDFLIESALDFAKCKGEHQKDRMAARCPAAVAMRFLQFLVGEGLMPPRTTVKDCQNALFSRQWYSTICEFAEEKEEESKKPLRLSQNGRVFPLPFFPVGLTDRFPDLRTARFRALGQAFDDAYRRFERLVQRTLAGAEYRGAEKQISELGHLLYEVQTKWHKPGDLSKYIKNPDTAMVSVEYLREWSKRLRSIVMEAECFIPSFSVTGNGEDNVHQDRKIFLPAAESIDAHDVYELLEWHKFRLNIVEAELNRLPLVTVLDESSTQESHTVDMISALTGYACSGSWMTGVLRPARSPEISWRLVEEITSMESAKKRSEIGAGIPARKDFFEFYGEGQVKYARHLTWNKLLLFSGSRARRRDRTVCAAIHVSDLSECVYRHLMRCLSAAAECQKLADCQQLAADAVKSILEHVTKQMKRVWHEKRRQQHCLLCPRCGDCRDTFGKTPEKSSNNSSV